MSEAEFDVEALEYAMEEFDKAKNCMERAELLSGFHLKNFDEDDTGTEGLRRLMLYVMERAHSHGYMEGHDKAMKRRLLKGEVLKKPWN